MALTGLESTSQKTFHRLESPANANDKNNGSFPGVGALSNDPPISRPLKRNYGLFSRKPTNNNPEIPKKDPNGSGNNNKISQTPAMKKNSQPTSTFSQRLSQTSKKKNKQCSLEEEETFLKNKQKSLQAQKELEEKLGKPIKAVIAQKSDHRYFIGAAEAQDKFLHALDFGVATPESFDLEYAQSLTYEDRLNYLRDRTVLPEESVREFQVAMRDHVLLPNTKELSGTFGANREARDGTPKTYGTHLYNSETGLDLFFKLGGNRLKSGWETNKGQRKDIQMNQNLT